MYPPHHHQHFSGLSHLRRPLIRRGTLLIIPISNGLATKQQLIILTNTNEKALTFVLSSLLFTATVLECLFGEYHSSLAALGKQHPEVTKQPLVCDWSATSEVLCDVNCCFARNAGVEFVQRVNTMTVKDLARLPLRCHCTCRRSRDGSSDR